MDYRAGLRSLLPHEYLTQDLANGTVRVFAVEEVVDEHDRMPSYENLRAVAKLEWEHGLELCDFLSDFLWEIDQEVQHINQSGSPDSGRRRSMGSSEEERLRAVQALLAPGRERPCLLTVIGFSAHLPGAVTTAVFAELERFGIDSTIQNKLAAELLSKQARPDGSR